MTKHTPVSYGYFKSQESRFFQSEKWAITGPDHDHEESWDIVADGIPDETTARFIVTACNCHADLLEACTYSLEWIENLIEIHGEKTIIDSMPNHWGGRIIIRQAIRKAEEQIR